MTAAPIEERMTEQTMGPERPASMTGFAALDGETPDGRWRWELRSVNAKGLDVRLRVPHGLEAEEEGWRVAARSRFSRGAVSISLSLEETTGAAGVRLSRTGLRAALDAAEAARDEAERFGLPPSPMSLDGLLSMRGVLEPEGRADPEARSRLAAAAGAAFGAALDGLAAARRAEGARLADGLAVRADEIAALVDRADAQAAARLDPMRARLAARVQELLAAGAPTDPDRLAHEFALLAQKADVSEEIDRLRSHIARLRELLAADEPVGRTMEFLSQELNREANTLCAKSNDAALTETGVSLKVAVDQVREQAANIE